jgi:site-specific DNA recombinase
MPSEYADQSCGIYPRVSTIKQTKNSRSSLQDQENACRDYARALNMAVDEACVKPEAFTSLKKSRPELNSLLAEMKARQVRHLIVDRVDRMTRAGQLVALTFLQQFTRAGSTRNEW